MAWCCVSNGWDFRNVLACGPVFRQIFRDSRNCRATVSKASVLVHSDSILAREASCAPLQLRAVDVAPLIRVFPTAGQRDPAERKNTTHTRTTANHNNTAAITKHKFSRQKKNTPKIGRNYAPWNRQNKATTYNAKKEWHGRAVRMQVAKISRNTCNLVSRVLHSLNLVQKDPKITKKHRLEIKKQKHVALHARRLASTPSPSHAMPKWCNLNLKSWPWPNFQRHLGFASWSRNTQ